MARSITVIPARQISTAESGTAQTVQKRRMAAYCRVSTDQEEQLLSYEKKENQIIAGYDHTECDCHALCMVIFGVKIAS